MSRPVIGYHSIFGAYGFWLPNDPRGSWSKEVKAEHLKAFGDPIQPGTRSSVVARRQDVGKRLEAKKRLLRKNVIFVDDQIECLGRGFEELIERTKLIVFAIAVMPDHVHVVYPRPQCDAEEFVGMFKRAGSRALRKEGKHPFAMETPRVAAGPKRDEGEREERVPTPGAEKAWHVFLDDADEIRQRIDYVNDNPIKAGRPAQRCRFVTEFADAPRGRGG